MVHNNKILTVSYGTFSCTLEGFDDSFDTMKAIAEYFRDLAADDRYFGAEPPQPDADMLARIAQREITRQVEAHSTDTGTIVLRATAPAAPLIDTPVPDPAPVSAPVTAPAPVPAPAPASTAPAPQESGEPAIEVIPDSAAEPVQEPAAEPELVAEVKDVTETPVEVAEIDDQLAPEAAETKAELAVSEAPVTIPDQIAEPVAEPEPIAEPPVLRADIPETADAEADEDVLKDVVTDIAAEVDAEADQAPEVEADMAAEVEIDATKPAQAAGGPETIPGADSIAAKLQRIRAVVSQNESLAQMDDYTEDQHADGFVAEAAADIEQSLEIDDEIADAPEVDDPDDQISRILDQFDADQSGQATGIAGSAGDAGQQDAPDVATVETTGITETTETTEPIDDTLLADTVQVMAGQDTPDTDDGSFADRSSDANTGLVKEPDSDNNDPTQVEPAEEMADNALGDDPVDGAGALNQARIIKVKRADIDAAIANGQLENAEDDAEDDRDFFDSAAAGQNNTLSPEDEAELMRELAAVEDELVSGADGAKDDATDATGFEDNIFNEVNASPDEDRDVEDDAHAALRQTDTENEADLSRLLSEADEKLDDPETSSRHETYSQLRAAVAVAEAERSAGGTLGGASGDEAYRDDLAEVVRPRRMAIEGTRANRPVIDARPAPLKLVAEQRVDNGASIAQRGPVRPRRVMTPPAGEAGSLDATTADSEFAEFAARMGATELPDLLEAAAAYLSFVEGHDKFSRPQLMSKVRLIKQDDYNREDGLRSFGQLLRDGKIEKRGGGRFAASGEIGFRPDEREAG